MTKTISNAMDKGGTGKTTTIYNVAIYASDTLKHNSLLIDLDENSSLTDRFIDKIPSNYKNPDGSIKKEYTVAMFFEGKAGGTPSPIKLNEHLSIICGYSDLQKLRHHVESNMQRNYLLSWYYKNLDEIEKQYDYIFIDNHNDLGIFTDNALAIADIALAVVDVDLDSMKKIAGVVNHVEELKDIMRDPMSQQSYVTAKVVKVANMIEYNTRDSHVFLEAWKEMQEKDKTFLGYIYRRTAAKQTKTQNLPLVEVAKTAKMDKGTKQFFDDIWELFDKILASSSIES